jgi:hypothetical protein
MRVQRQRPAPERVLAPVPERVQVPASRPVQVPGAVLPVRAREPALAWAW